jgi:DNA-binding MarR family transcriptional regulator
MMPQPTASSTPDLSPRQQRILTWMKDGNRIFEVLDKKYFTLYEDKRDLDHRIRKEEIEELEGLGLIRQVPNPDGSRLDSWELTDRGHDLTPTSKLSQ